MRVFVFVSIVATFALAAPAVAQDRLEEELFDDAPVVEEAPASDEAVEENEAPRRRLVEEDDADGDEEGDAPDEAATPDGEEPPVGRYVSAGVSGATGALTGAVAGAGLAFAHAGLWTLADGDVGGLMGLGFMLFPLAGAAGGALFGVYPFVDPVGMGASAGAAAAGAGLGALLGLGVGSLVAGPQGRQKFPGENEWTAIALTATALGAGVGAAVGAATAAPFFVVE